MRRVADRYTCYAFDSPGFGLSDPLPDLVQGENLPAENLTVADFADALAEVLAAIDMPACPVFGCHTGAAIAVELAARHPQRVTGILLDGLSMFSDAEAQTIVGAYFQPIAIDPLGGHYSATWTRMRDQSIWFPWFARDQAALSENDLNRPVATHRWVEMFFDAQDSYVPGYRAAMVYRDGARRIAQLKAPVEVTAIESDMLYPHLDRLMPVRPGVTIHRIGDSVDRRRALTGPAFDRFTSPGQPPEIAADLPQTDRPGQQFIDLNAMQALVRMAGDPAHPPLLIVHDVPGAGAGVGPVMADLANRYRVFTVDLPGCGETPPLDDCSRTGFVRFLWMVVDALGLAQITIVGIGFGSSLAIGMALARPAQVHQLALAGCFLGDTAMGDNLRANFVPALSIEPDGSHWFRTWQMLRDSEIWWPWFVHTRTALRRVTGDFDAKSLHRRTCEAMRQPGGYAAVIDVALHQSAPDAIAALGVPVVFIRGAANPIATAYDARAEALFPDLPWLTLGELR